MVLSLLITTVNGKELEVGNYYFTTDWCGPCKTQKPIIEKLQKEGFNIKIYKKWPDELNIKIVPTIIIVKKDGTLKLEGLQTYEELKKVLLKKVYKLW